MRSEIALLKFLLFSLTTWGTIIMFFIVVLGWGPISLVLSLFGGLPIYLQMEVFGVALKRRIQDISFVAGLAAGVINGFNLSLLYGAVIYIVILLGPSINELNTVVLCIIAFPILLGPAIVSYLLIVQIITLLRKK